MKKIVFITLTFITASVLLLEACRKKDKAVQAGTPLNFTIPAGFPATTVFQNNPLTEEGFALGKKLFYDGRLSIDGNFPCVSCHNQYAAFGTYDHDLSHGYNGQHTKRNAPGLFNLAWYPAFHWDGGINKLEEVPPYHITASNEMAETIPNVIGKLNADTAYQRLFKNAFGDNVITADRMNKALAQFLANMVSANSKYDSVKKGLTTFTITEQAGYDVFKTKCNGCHTEPLFTDFSYRNIGMDLNGLNDVGRMKVTGNKEDSLKFRVPSLRNIARTYPYMHDGSMEFLDNVLDHYATLNTSFPGLDPLLKKGIVLSPSERNAVKFFLYTLTDYSFLEDKKYQQ